MNIAAFLARAGRVHPEGASVYGGAHLVMNHSQLSHRVARLAGGLVERMGLRPADHVAIVMKNCPAYLEAMFACWHAGLVCVPVNAKLHAREVAHILDDSGARLVLASDDLAGVVQAAVGLADRTPEVLVAGSAEYERLAASEGIDLHAVAESDLAWLFYTSGTTGRPKGAMLTHRNLAAMAFAYLTEVDPTAPGDCLLHPAPLSHGSGLYAIPTMLAMAAQVVPESGGFDPAEIADLLHHHAGASFFAAPTMVSRLVAADVVTDTVRANLRTIIYGGGPMYVEDCRRALDVLGPRLAQIYGQGESPMTITVLPRHMHVADDGPEALDARLASVGYAQAPVEVRIAGTGGAPAMAGEVGEVLVRGAPVMAGYWRNLEATAAALKGGWLHTGDLGSMDARGFLTLKDRSKDVIISGGTNIYPREVEEVLLQHDGIAEVAIIGRRHPDWGEEVVAFVSAKPGARVAAAELDELCLRNIARFKRPKEYIFLDTLPKNNYGKILKTDLRRMLGAEG